jgi:hypothetical protein
MYPVATEVADGSMKIDASDWASEYVIQGKTMCAVKWDCTDISLSLVIETESSD